MSILLPDRDVQQVQEGERSHDSGTATSISSSFEYNLGSSPPNQSSTPFSAETLSTSRCSTGASTSNSYARSWILPQEPHDRRTHSMLGLPQLDHNETSFSADSYDQSVGITIPDTIAAQSHVGKVAFQLSGPRYTATETNAKLFAATPTLYQPLRGATSFRVLLLHPGNDNDQIQCTLNMIDLNRTDCSYAALSYVWGSRDPLLEIKCNDTPILVTQNLKLGLQRIRDRCQTRIVWVDALCINQSDDIERGSQVKLMRQIYSSAKKVLIWLGHHDSDQATCAFTALRSIAEGASHQNVSGNICELIEAPGVRNSLEVLYGLEYFQRIWVLQEVTVAASALLMWGHDEISWDIVGRGTYLIRNTRSAYQRLSDDRLRGLLHAYLMYRLPHSEFQPTTFFDLLRMTSQFLATDDRDKVFAILGLPNRDSDPLNGELFIEPDYTLSLQEVHEKVALKILRTSSMPFDLLSSVDHGDYICPELPSWIPQWHNNFSLDLVSHRQDAQYQSSGGSWSGNIESVLHLWETSHYILTSGFEYDTIAATTVTLKTRGEGDDWYRTTINPWFEQIQALPSGTQYSWQDRALTLLAGKNW